MALKTLLDIGLAPKGTVILEYVTDEEVSGLGTLACVTRGYKADAGISSRNEDFEGLRINTLTHQLFPDNRGALSCAIGKFEAGHYASATPDRAILHGSIGPMPQEDIEQVKKEFQTFIRKRLRSGSLAQHASA
jgi:acetylornithine deacetylase